MERTPLWASNMLAHSTDLLLSITLLDSRHKVCNVSAAICNFHLHVFCSVLVIVCSLKDNKSKFELKPGAAVAQG